MDDNYTHDGDGNDSTDRRRASWMKMTVSLTRPHVVSHKKEFMKSLGHYIRKQPRMTSALAYGACTMAAAHFAWVPDARMHGMPLTVAAGVSHAVAGLLTGQRLLNRKSTWSSLQAGSLGAVTSLLAMVFFSIVFAVYLANTDVRPDNVLSHLAVPVLISVFSFVAVWWAFVIVSIGVGLILYRVVTS